MVRKISSVIGHARSVTLCTYHCRFIELAPDTHLAAALMGAQSGKMFTRNKHNPSKLVMPYL